MGGERATIIGGQGFIGTALAQRLAARGWDCQVPARAEISALAGDLGHVFYCAGLTADYLRRPYDTIEAHVSVVSRLLHTTSYTSLVYLSSTRLYDSSGGGTGTEEQDLLFNPSNPRHLYDLSKSLGEAACLALGGGRARVARLACVYRDHTDADGFLPALLRDVLRARGSAPHGPLAVESSPHFERDYVHLDDVLDALVLIATRGTQLIYNVASGRNLSNAALFAEVTRLSGVDIVASRGEKGTTPALVSIDRMREEFGWHPVDVLEKIGEILNGQNAAGAC